MPARRWLADRFFDMKKSAKKYVVMTALVILTGSKAAAQFSDSVHHYLGYAATGIFNQTSTSNSFVYQ